MEQYQKKKRANEEVKKNDLQERVCKTLPKEYLDNNFFRDSILQLDSIIGMLNLGYFGTQNL